VCIEKIRISSRALPSEFGVQSSNSLLNSLTSRFHLEVLVVRAIRSIVGELIIKNYKLFCKAIFWIPIVKVKLLKVAVFLDLYWGDIVLIDQLSAKVTVVNPFNTHMPSPRSGYLDTNP
jgi:hypothetical protein